MKRAKIIYNSAEDKYEIYINVDGTWGLDTAYKCFKKENQESDEPAYIHFSIINKLCELEFLGYKITFMYL